MSWNATGPRGATGPVGPTGAPGTDGNTILNGKGAPTDGIGRAGDFYIDTATWTIYGPRTADGWSATGQSLVGPSGVNGANGTNGSSILHGTGAPSSDTGAVGDFYIDTTTWTIYGAKTGDGWPADGQSLLGPAGANGATILSGTGAPTSDAGDVGDFYIDTASWTIYGPKTADGWPLTGTSLIGPGNIIAFPPCFPICFGI